MKIILNKILFFIFIILYYTMCVVKNLNKFRISHDVISVKEMTLFDFYLWRR